MEYSNELKNYENISSNHLKIGIIGMPNTGKSLLFNLLVSDPLYQPTWEKRRNRRNYENFINNFNLDQNNNQIDSDLKNHYEIKLENDENYLMNLYELDTVQKVDLISEEYSSTVPLPQDVISSAISSSEQNNNLSSNSSVASTSSFYEPSSSINIGNLTGKLIFSKKRSVTSTEFFSTTSNVIGTILPFNNDIFSIYNLLINNNNKIDDDDDDELDNNNNNNNLNKNEKNKSYCDFFYCLNNNMKYYNRLNQHDHYLKYYNNNITLNIKKNPNQYVSNRKSFTHVNKIIPTELTFIDTPSIVSGSFRDGNGLGMNSYEDLVYTDIIIICLRTFDQENNSFNIFNPQEHCVSSYSSYSNPSHPSHPSNLNNTFYPEQFLNNDANIINNNLSIKFSPTNSYGYSSSIPYYESNERKLFKTKVDYIRNTTGEIVELNNSGSPFDTTQSGGFFASNGRTTGESPDSQSMGSTSPLRSPSPSRGFDSPSRGSPEPQSRIGTTTFQHNKIINDYELDENFHLNNEINNLLIIENELKQRDLYKIEQALHHIEFIFYYQKELYMGHEGESISFFYKSLLTLWEFIAGIKRPALPKNTYRNKFKEYKGYISRMEEIYNNSNFHEKLKSKSTASNNVNDKTILSFLDEFSNSTLNISTMNSSSKIIPSTESKPLIDTRTLSSCFNPSNLISPLSLPPNVINSSYKKPLNLLNLFEESPIELPPFLHRIPRLCKGRLLREGVWDNNIRNNIISPLNLLTFKKFLYVVNCNQLDYSRYFNKKMKLNQEVNEDENDENIEDNENLMRDQKEESNRRLNKNYELYHTSPTSKNFEEVINYLEAREKKIYGDSFKKTYLSGYPSILPVSLVLEEKNFNIIQENGYEMYEDYIKSCCYFNPTSSSINSFNYKNHINNKLTLNVFSQSLLARLKDQIQSCLKLQTYYLFHNKELIENYGREGITISDIMNKIENKNNLPFQTEVISADEFINYEGDMMKLSKDGKIHIESSKYVINDRDLIKIVPIEKK